MIDLLRYSFNSTNKQWIELISYFLGMKGFFLCVRKGKGNKEKKRLNHPLGCDTHGITKVSLVYGRGTMIKNNHALLRRVSRLCKPICTFIPFTVHVHKGHLPIHMLQRMDQHDGGEILMKHVDFSSD